MWSRHSSTSSLFVAQIRVSCLHRWHRSGPGSASLDPSRAADGSDRRPCAGLQIRRSSSTLPSGPDHEPSGHRSRPLYSCRLGRPGGIRIASRLRCADCRPKALDHPSARTVAKLRSRGVRHSGMGRLVHPPTPSGAHRQHTASRS